MESKDEILLIVKDAVQQAVQQLAEQIKQEIGQQQLGQVGQQGGQQLSDQVAKAISQAVQETKQASQGTTQEKSNVVDSVTQNKQEEINTGEAHRSNIYTKTRLWDFDDKQIAASEQSERVKSLDYDIAKKALDLQRDQIDLSEKQASAAKVKTLQHVESMFGLLNVYAQIQSVADQTKFNAAVSEPIAPNTQKSGNES